MPLFFILCLKRPYYFYRIYNYTMFMHISLDKGGTIEG